MSADSAGSAIKALIIPFFISLLLFSLVTFVLVPVWRHYRTRYGQYLPLDSISQHTNSLRSRIFGRLTRFFMPSRWRRNGGSGEVVFASGRDSPDSATIEEGEELDEVDEHMLRAIERHTHGTRPDSERRLSRDLEEGFRDDSDEEPGR